MSKSMKTGFLVRVCIHKKTVILFEEKTHTHIFLMIWCMYMVRVTRVVWK